MISGWEAVDSRIGGRASHGPLFLGSVTLSGDYTQNHLVMSEIGMFQQLRSFNPSYRLPSACIQWSGRQQTRNDICS
jgi:hypothetical protein